MSFLSGAMIIVPANLSFILYFLFMVICIYIIKNKMYSSYITLNIESALTKPLLIYSNESL